MFMFCVRKKIQKVRESTKKHKMSPLDQEFEF